MFSIVMPYALTLIGVLVGDGNDFMAFAVFFTVIGVVWTFIAATVKEFRGKGLGTQALEWFREQYASARRLRLEVNRENEGAIRLYQRKGYHFLEYLQMVEEHRADSRANAVVKPTLV